MNYQFNFLSALEKASETGGDQEKLQQGDFYVDGWRKFLSLLIEAYCKSSLIHNSAYMDDPAS